MILIIDDDERFLEITSRRLRTRGFEALCASSWVEAAPMLREQVDLVLLDVRMYSLSGERLCVIIKERYPRTLVVFHSSEPESVLRALTASHGADGYITKSVDRDELIGRIDDLLTNRRVLHCGAVAGAGG